MKIGIVTYHRTLNYGACLQAIATRVTLEKFGHNVYYVDYWPKYHKQIYEVFSLGRFLSLGLRTRIDYLINTIKRHKYLKVRIRNFEQFFSHYIYPYCKPIDEEFDVIVYGSDQIWRKQGTLNGYNPVYFGQNNFHASKHIAYSVSMGILPKSEADREKVKELVSHLNKIAVREDDLLSLLHELGYNDVALTLDPTLLLSSDEWDSIIPSTEKNGDKYILVYGMGKIPFNMDYVKKFANEHDCVVRTLSGITSESPENFINLIKNAEYVFTSSFHGLAFSIIYGKQFFASYSTNSNRAQTLLDHLGIKDRMVKKGAPIPEDIMPVDYEKVYGKLESLREKSIIFLKSL